VKVNVKYRLWKILNKLILDEREQRTFWDQSHLNAIASAMDEEQSAPEVFKNYLDYLEHSKLSGTVVRNMYSDV